VRLSVVTELPCAQDSKSLPQSSFGVLACIPSTNHFRKDGKLLREFHTHKSWGELQQQCIGFKKLFCKNLKETRRRITSVHNICTVCPRSSGFLDFIKASLLIPTKMGNIWSFGILFVKTPTFLKISKLL
jgi:hypothetical protein